MQPSLHRPIPGQRSVASVEPTFGRWRRDRARGQTLVEFALVIPLFIVMLVGIIEFGFAMNAVLAVSFATREAALVAAEAGSADGADCMILTKVEESISAPSADGNINRVLIFKSDHNGARLATNTYVRTGSTTCTYSGGSTLTVPYELSGAQNYEDVKRCSMLGGCDANPPLAATTTVDHVGVQVDYDYSWRTPLSSLIGLGGSGYTIIESNSMRMEPIL